jgi:hypothetical protein
MSIDDEPLVLMVDRALAQTARAGHTYAAVPEPWLIEWIRAIGIGQTSRFDWSGLCIHPFFRNGGAQSYKYPEVDGDRYLCLLPHDHEGPCGYEHMINPKQVRGRSEHSRHTHVSTVLPQGD